MLLYINSNNENTLDLLKANLAKTSSTKIKKIKNPTTKVQSTIFEVEGEDLGVSIVGGELPNQQSNSDDDDSGDECEETVFTNDKVNDDSNKGNIGLTVSIDEETRNQKELDCKNSDNNDQQPGVKEESIKARKKRKKRELLAMTAQKIATPVNLSLNNSSSEREWLLTVDNANDVPTVIQVFKLFLEFCDKDRKHGEIKLEKINKLKASAKSNRASVVEDKAKKIAIIFMKRHFLLNKNKK